MLCYITIPVTCTAHRILWFVTKTPHVLCSLKTLVRHVNTSLLTRYSEVPMAGLRSSFSRKCRGNMTKWPLTPFNSSRAEQGFSSPRLLKVWLKNTNALTSMSAKGSIKKPSVFKWSQGDQEFSQTKWNEVKALQNSVRKIGNPFKAMLNLVEGMQNKECSQRDKEFNHGNVDFSQRNWEFIKRKFESSQFNS